MLFISSLGAKERIRTEVIYEIQQQMLFTGFNIMSLDIFLTNQVNEINSILLVFYQRKSYFRNAYLLSLVYSDDISAIWVQTANNWNYIFFKYCDLK